MFKSMINKISGNDYYVYTKQKHINTLDSGVKFSLENNDSGLPESNGNKDKELSTGKMPQPAEDPGVRLELSGGSQNPDAYEQQTPKTVPPSAHLPQQTSLPETIQSFIRTAIRTIQNFFYQLWNGRPPEDDSLEISEDPSQEIFDETSSVPSSEEELLTRRIRQSLQDGDIDQAISLLTDNGKKTIARNSTLLTSYDKNGRVVEPDVSNRNRVLYGDRNTVKL